jgi:hypothetical protein
MWGAMGLPTLSRRFGHGLGISIAHIAAWPSNDLQAMLCKQVANCGSWESAMEGNKHPSLDYGSHICYNVK